MRLLLTLFISFALASPAHAWWLTKSQVVASGASCSGDYGEATTGDYAWSPDSYTIRLSKISLDCSGTIDSITVRLTNAYDADREVKFLIYSDNGDEPNTKLYESAATYFPDSFDASHWCTISSVGEGLTGDPEYIWVGFYMEDKQGSAPAAWWYEETGGTVRAAVMVDFTSAPTTWNTGTDSAEIQLDKVYVTFE